MKRVLFVDDESLVLEIIERKMEKTDIKCYFAKSADEGIEILKKYDVDVMVSDLQMPVTNGLDLSILATKISPRTIRIVLSGSSRTSSIIDSINQGHIYQYIVKPWHIDDQAIELIQEAVRVSKRWSNVESKEVYVHADDLWKFKDLNAWVLLDSLGKIVKSNTQLKNNNLDGLPETKIKSSIGELRLIETKM